jgi:mannitol/fructose-specific phosphotransferase system IIA component (Ntr-type)
MEATSKADVIKELTHLLFEKKKMEDVGPALDQILAREMTESTGIGHGLAVPHGRVTGMKDLACAVGRLPQGIEFNSVDKKPVHLVFLICYPPPSQTTYMNFLATVSRLLRDEEHLNAILHAEDADGIYANLEEISTTYKDRTEEQLKQVLDDPGIELTEDAHADLILLTRLQLYEEMRDSTRTGKTQVRERIEAVRSLVTPRILSHYDRVSKARPPAIVPVEADTCQGCFMKLPSQFVQKVRQDADHIHTCTNCSRFVYVV